MGNKTNPLGFRFGISKEYKSIYYIEKNKLASITLQDKEIRDILLNKYEKARVEDIQIKRFENKINILLYIFKIGNINAKLTNDVNELLKIKYPQHAIDLNLIPVSKEISAKLLAEDIATQMEMRMPFRRAMKQALSKMTYAKAKGGKILLSGRLGGVDIARSEKYSFGSIKLQTLKNDIDYYFCEADMKYGKIGIKVWISWGNVPFIKNINKEKITIPKESEEEKINEEDALLNKEEDVLLNKEEDNAIIGMENIINTKDNKGINGIIEEKNINKEKEEIIGE